MREHDHQHDHQHEEGTRILLDGSYGAGTQAELTIITRVGKDGHKEETFIVPYAVLAKDKLQNLLDYNFIKGYRVEKTGTVDTQISGLKEMGL